MGIYMNKKLLLLLVALPLVPGCSEDSSFSSILQTCRKNEKLYEGRCYNINECLPACDDNTQKCIKGTCYDKNVCVPACDDDTEKCADGTCIGKSECYPACNAETHVCNNGTCEPIDPTACVGKQCKNASTFCDETGHWNDCQKGYGCHLGYCLKGLAPECEDNECSEDSTRECQGGSWVPCGSFETCVDGKCQLQEIACEPQSCSDDNAYYCSENNVFTLCPAGTVCKEGRCENSVEIDDAFLWKSCESNADCARGVCVFEVSTSRTMSVAQIGIKDADTIPLSALDNRILPGTGVCSADCTRDPAICDYISTDATKYTCQIIVTGDSPYPPKDEYLQDMTLPFHNRLNIGDMTISPYGSICRPNDPKEKAYQKTFCKSCENIGDCSGSEACIDGVCLQPCSNTDQCPFSFSCQQPFNMEASYCMPNAGTCGACIDKDGDGQGYGACEKTGFDCDDLREDAYYQKILSPDSCTDDYTDDNCNGKVDKLELIGSPDNCDACGSSCKVGENASHIDRQCELNNGDIPLDDSTPENVAQTYVYGCFDYCEPGYADCNNDVSDGCETKLFDIDENGHPIATDDAVLYTVDGDRDGHGVVDFDYAHFCCKSTESSDNKVCYAQPHTHANAKNFWDHAVLQEDTLYSVHVDDCDDSDNARFPQNPEICDGVDNDCDASTPDGYDALVKLQNYDYVEATSTDTNTYKLNDTCVLYETHTGYKCNEHGQILCAAKASGGFEMICNASTTASDGGDCNGVDGEDCCNGIDDNCNGQIDEDFEMTACNTGNSGICNMGVRVCDGPQNIVCNQLFEPRVYDFYGDGIDSDCDGYDWDHDKAVFIEKYGGGNYDGNDSDTEPNKHTGSPDRPYATLTKAFLAASSVINNQPFYKDIIVSGNVVNMTSSGALWGKTPIIIPTLASTYNPNLYAAITHAQHVENYKTAYHDHVIYKANLYLYPGEVYPPKETIRIYGGFSTGSGTWTPPSERQFSTYQYYVDSSLADSDGVLKANHYELVRSDGKYPLSVKFDHFMLMIEAADKIYAKQSGTTFVGIDCGKNGCRDLSLINSNVSVKGAPGAAAVSQKFPNNDNWTNRRNGVNGDWFRLENGGHSELKKNYNNNACMSRFWSGSWEYYTSYGDYYAQQCPDGSIPRGGCPGTWCCPWRVESGESHDPACNDFLEANNGLSGNGTNGGVGAKVSLKTDDGCDDDQIVDPDKAAGGLGTLGKGGNGGDNSKLTLEFSIGANDVYVATYSNGVKDDTSAADGEPGEAGGGGGGGGVYYCFTRRSGTKDHWMFAGSGGAGGCGGYGGKAGGTGGSAIGIILTPPNYPDKSTDANVLLTTTIIKDGRLQTIVSSVDVSAANGGAGHEGQTGVPGGAGGKSIGYADEEAGIDYHCHKGTAGGAGASGGGGGGGAGGHAGEAYGIMFLCNRTVSGYDGLNDLIKCGFNVDANYLDSPNGFASVHAGKSGSRGLNGSKGAWLSNNDDTADKNANAESQAGQYGAGGTTGGGLDGKTSDFVLLKTNKF